MLSVGVLGELELELDGERLQLPARSAAVVRRLAESVDDRVLAEGLLRAAEG